MQWDLGNVWEMCWVLYTLYTSNSPVSHDDTQSISRVDRGELWIDDVDNFRPTNRAFIEYTSRTDTVGFRLVHFTLFGSRSRNRI